MTHFSPYGIPIKSSLTPHFEFSRPASLLVAIISGRDGEGSISLILCCRLVLLYEGSKEAPRQEDLDRHLLLMYNNISQHQRNLLLSSAKMGYGIFIQSNVDSGEGGEGEGAGGRWERCPYYRAYLHSVEFKNVK